MKKVIVGLSLVVLASSLALAAPEARFSLGGKYLTAQVGLNSWAIPFGANFEYGLTENIGIGGNLMVFFWSSGGVSQSVIIPEADAAYHFTSLDIDKVDLFAGGGIGFAMYHASVGDWSGHGSSGLYLTPFLGGRYYVSPKIAVSLRLNVGLIGSWSGVGAVVGATFKL